MNFNFHKKRIRKLHGKMRNGHSHRGWHSLGCLFMLLIATEFKVAEPVEKQRDSDLPIFLEPVVNATVAVGRDASLSCVVDNLGQHKVAWVHLDRKMIVAIHRQVVSRLQRFYVTHDSHKTWTLHVTQVTQKDRGYYMCQVNTTPMISQKGYLQVVVPPNIVDNASSGSSLLVRERDNVTLKCQADGVPSPQIRWRREDGVPISTDSGRKENQIQGEILVLNWVSREHMGAYLCIASNGIPPSVSKRITVEVEFPPQMHVPNQLVSVPLGIDVQLECQIEASPKPVVYWSHQGIMISNSSRIMSQTMSNSYRYTMLLTIKDVSLADYGLYLCVAKNSFAETNGSIKLNRFASPTKPPNINNNNNPYHSKRINQHATSPRKRIGEGTSSDSFDEDQKIFDTSGTPFRKESPTSFDRKMFEETKRRAQVEAEKEKRNRNLSMKAMNEFDSRGEGFSSTNKIPLLLTTINLYCFSLFVHLTSRYL